MIRSCDVEIIFADAQYAVYVDGDEAGIDANLEVALNEAKAKMREAFYEAEDQAENPVAESAELYGVRAGVDFPATLPGARKVA
jgi:hypothetical protein